MHPKTAEGIVSIHYLPFNSGLTSVQSFKVGGISGEGGVKFTSSGEGGE